MPSKHKAGDVERLTDMAFSGFPNGYGTGLHVTYVSCKRRQPDHNSTIHHKRHQESRKERSRLRLGTSRRTIYDSTVPPPSLPAVPQRHSLHASHMNDEPMRHTMRPMRTGPGKRRGLYEFASEESAARPLHETMPGHRSRDTVQTTA